MLITPANTELSLTLAVMNDGVIGLWTSPHSQHTYIHLFLHSPFMDCITDKQPLVALLSIFTENDGLNLEKLRVHVKRASKHTKLAETTES